MDKRTETIIMDLVKSTREVLDRHSVSFPEYRAAVGFLMQYAKAPEFEIPLTLDMLFNATVADIEMKARKGSVSNLEGPYFLEGTPEISDRIQTRSGEGEPLSIRGKVIDLDGKPVQGAELHIWHSDVDGLYSGYNEEFPIELYRGRKIIGASGEFCIHTTVPAPYMIPHEGPSGRLLELMGRHPWRPAHLHFKIRANGFQEHTTQAYFDGGEWLDSDCVEGVRPKLIHSLVQSEDGKTLEIDFVLDPV